MSVAEPVIDSLDRTNKWIKLLSGATVYHPVEDIYVEVRRLVRIDESLRGMDMPVTAKGSEFKGIDNSGAAKYTPRQAFFNDGWKVRPVDEDQVLEVTGEQITDDGHFGSACIDTEGLTSRVIIHYEPPSAEIIRDEKSLAAIRHMAFNNAVTYDAVNGYPGTGETQDGYDIGTPIAPSSVITDAGTIAVREGFKLGRVVGDLTIDDSVTIEGFTFSGEGGDRSNFHIEDEAYAYNLAFEYAHVTGTMDGHTKLTKCLITELSYLNGYISECVLSQGTIVLGGSNICVILDSKGGDGISTIDMGGTGQGLINQNFNGSFKIINKTGPEAVVIGLSSGYVSIDTDTVTSGSLIISGTGMLIDANTGENMPTGTYGSLEVINRLVYNEGVAAAVLDSEIEGGVSLKESVRLHNAAAAGKLSISGNVVRIRDVGDTKNRITATTDVNGQRTSVTRDVS